ncbi:MAG: TrkH family potassium uptake protein [Lachnospiraceae bacterium]
MNTLHKRHVSSFHIILFGFAGTILLGTLLLMLPFASVERTVTSFSDALFTATSAVCVTGLVVQDTATHWSVFGQSVIMILIQIGGLGIVTVAVATAIISGRKIGLMQRSTMQESISAPKVGGIVRLTGFILKATFIMEIAGAVCLLPVFLRDFGLRGIWMSVFHSVSAFCNAGFDLMGKNEAFSSLTSYSSEMLINVVIMILIIIGGMGFLVWDDIKTNKFHWKKYRMQTKVVLTTTAVLIVVPSVFFYFCEFDHFSGKERILSALFQAVTPRTAGFNTADLTRMSSTGRMLTIILMLIGGSPGSTAGGMKTTTIAVLVFSAISVFLRKDNVECFDRRIADSAIKNAAAILLMYLILFLFGGMIISEVEGLPLGSCLFETASAIGTVGLTLGITPMLGGISRMILIALMFFGRVGGLTIIFAAVSASRQNIAKKPQEKITVG